MTSQHHLRTRGRVAIAAALLVFGLPACGHGRSGAIPPTHSAGTAQQAHTLGRSRARHFKGLVDGVLPPFHDPVAPVTVQARVMHKLGTGTQSEREFAALRSPEHVRAVMARERSPRNVVTSSDSGGQFGIYIYPQPNRQYYSGTFGFQTGYERVEQYFLSGAVLYAPTNRGAGGNCLEIGSDANVSYSEVYAYDFCDGTGQFHFLFTIDDYFRGSYERNYGDGLPSYAYETYYDAGKNKWTFLIFNASTGQWEHVYDSQSATISPTADPTAGWNMFETHFFTPNGACPPVLTAHSFGLQWINPQTGWEYLDSEPGASFNFHDLDPRNDCLNYDDGSGRGYYYDMSALSGHEWYVDSYPSQVDTGGGGGCDPVVEDCCYVDGTCLCDWDPSNCCDFDPSSCCDIYGYSSIQCPYAVQRRPTNRRRTTAESGRMTSSRGGTSPPNRTEARTPRR